MEDIMMILLMMNMNIFPQKLLFRMILNMMRNLVDMFYDKARDDLPCVTITPVTWDEQILTASDDDLPCVTITHVVFDGATIGIIRKVWVVDCFFAKK
jgi:hypothetical protein